MIQDKTVAEIRKAKAILDKSLGDAISKILSEWQKENGVSIDGIDLDFRTFQTDDGEKWTQLAGVDAKIERI